MKTPLLLAIFLHTFVLTHAQTTLQGKVTDGNDQPIAFANISIEDSYDGATSDDHGQFKFSSSESGRKVLVVTFIGYSAHREEIVMNGALLQFAIQLKENVRSLDAVTITAGTFTAGDQSGKTIFKALDIATTAGATADIAGALNTLPGTQKAGESGRLFVRGGDGTETRTFIDGMLVGDAYSPAAPNVASRGRFLPFMFKGISFSTGGYSAEYGQALSSALILESRDKAETTRTDIGILSVGADAGHTRVWERSSFGAKVQHTDLRPYFGLIPQDIDWKRAPNANELHAAFRQQSGQNGLFKLYTNLSNTRFSLRRPAIDNTRVEPFVLRNNFTYLNGAYKNTLNESWMVRAGISFTDVSANTVADTTRVSDKTTDLHGKIVFEGSVTERIEMKTGLEVMNHDQLERVHHNRFNEPITAFFTESDFYFTSRLIARTGFRLEYNGFGKRLSIDPRASLAYKTGSNSQVSFAYGQFKQSVGMNFLKDNRSLQPQQATHYILNFQHMESGRVFRVETYYKQYSRLVKLGQYGETDSDNSGHGYASGFELFWRDNQSLKNTDYWVSYSFLDTRRDYLDFTKPSTPSFASAHNFSAVLKHFIVPLKSQLGMTYSFTSGRPYRDPNAPDFDERWTPAYLDLSLNWSYLPTPSVIIYLSCTNLTGRDNIFGYEYTNTPDINGHYGSRPLRPPAKRFLFAAVFITLSKEKSVNQLPNL